MWHFGWDATVSHAAEKTKALWYEFASWASVYIAGFGAGALLAGLILLMKRSGLALVSGSEPGQIGQPRPLLTSATPAQHLTFGSASGGSPTLSRFAPELVPDRPPVILTQIMNLLNLAPEMCASHENVLRVNVVDRMRTSPEAIEFGKYVLINLTEPGDFSL